MFKVIVKGEAKAYDIADEEYKGENLQKFNGVGCQDEFTEHFQAKSKYNKHNHQGCIIGIVTNGYMRFEYDETDKKLYTITEYDSSRKLTQNELSTLMQFTSSQWSDDIGEKFEQHSVNRHEDAISAWFYRQDIKIVQEEVSDMTGFPNVINELRLMCEEIKLAPERLEGILDKIDYVDRTGHKWVPVAREIFIVDENTKTIKHGFMVHVEFQRPDTNTGKWGLGVSREEYIWDGADEDSIIKTVYVCIRLTEEHEVMESFAITVDKRKVRVFNPHRTMKNHAKGEISDVVSGGKLESE